MIENTFQTLDLIAAGWFVLCLFGLTAIARLRGTQSQDGLMRSVQARRTMWMRSMVRRDVRIVDGQLLANISGGNAFFASTSVIALGGLIAMLGAADQVKLRLEALPLVDQTSIALIEVKICLLAGLGCSCVFQVCLGLPPDALSRRPYWRGTGSRLRR